MKKYLFLTIALLCGVVQGARAQSQEYITDVMLIGYDNTTDVNALWNSYVNTGWRGVDYDLNKGAGGHFIYLMYKTNKCVGSTGSPINDLYLRVSGSGPSPNSLTHMGHTYYKAGYNGDSDFEGNEGDLNTGASGYWISLYYAKDPNSAVRINNIYFNGSEEFAVGENGGHTPCDLNKGTEQKGETIYLHFNKSIYLNRNGKVIETIGNWIDYRSSYTHVVDKTIYIESEEELAQLTYDASHGFTKGYTVVLNKDLDMSAHTWLPLGFNEYNTFQCIFEGNGHTIKGIYVGNLGHLYSGFIGYTHSAAGGVLTSYGCNYIRDLTLTDSYIEGGDYTGSIIGQNYAGTSVVNVVSNAEVIGNNIVGGIAGRIGGMSILAQSPFFQDNLYLGKVSAPSNASYRGAIAGLIEETMGYVRRSNNYYTDPASDVGNSNDVRAYPINESVLDGMSLNYSKGHTFNGTSYCPAGEANFTVKHDFNHSVTVKVNFMKWGSTDGVYSITFDPAKTKTYEVTVTLEDYNIAGNGTQDNPYLITNKADWDFIVNYLNSGSSSNDFSGVYFKLDADNITVNQRMGNASHPFSGIFDGGGNKITLDFGAPENYINQKCAAFYRIDNATIKNLVIDGNIYSSAQHNGSLAVKVTGGNNHINNCFSNVSINSNRSGDITTGGFIGILENNDVNVSFEGCAFLGEFLGANATNWGGFVGWRYYENNKYNTVSFTDCLFSPKTVNIATPDGSSSHTFCRNYDNVEGASYTNCYYTEMLQNADGGVQGYSVKSGTTGMTLYYGTPNTDYGYDGMKLYDFGMYCGGTLCTTAEASFAFTPVSPRIISDLTAANAASVIDNGNGSFTLTMNSKDVSVMPVYGNYNTVTLYDNQSNSATIEANNNLLADVTLSGRTLYRDGDWNTLCLPFDVEIEDSPLKGAEARTLSEATFSDGTLTLNFSDPVDELKAGTPYIIRWKKELIIKTPEDWNAFASSVSAGTSYYEKIVMLDADIEVSTMAGSDDIRSFQGTFDGRGHTLTFNATASELYNAPFLYVCNATIKNLHTAGTITTDRKFCSGLVGHATGTNTISNCWSSINIESSVSGDGTHAGFVAMTHNENTNTKLIDCLFDGSITGTNTNNCGGLIGWNDCTASLTNCVFKGSTDLATGGNATFSRGDNVTVTNCYYSENLPDATGQGTAIGSKTNEELASALGDGWKVSKNMLVTNFKINITEPLFEDVTINADASTTLTPGITEGTTGDGKVSFKGIYDPEELPGNDASNLYLGAGNNLYWPSEVYTLNAFRAYFTVDFSESGDLEVREIRMNLDGGGVTGVQSVLEQVKRQSRASGKRLAVSETGAWYDLFGRKLNGKPTVPGIYMNNGKKIAITK